MKKLKKSKWKNGHWEKYYITLQFPPKQSFIAGKWIRFKMDRFSLMYVLMCSIMYYYVMSRKKEAKVL